jgi:hypothetical protein
METGPTFLFVAGLARLGIFLLQPKSGDSCYGAKCCVFPASRAVVRTSRGKAASGALPGYNRGPSTAAFLLFPPRSKSPGMNVRLATLVAALLFPLIPNSLSAQDSKAAGRRGRYRILRSEDSACSAAALLRVPFCRSEERQRRTAGRYYRSPCLASGALLAERH